MASLANLTIGANLGHSGLNWSTALGVFENPPVPTPTLSKNTVDFSTNLISGISSPAQDTSSTESTLAVTGAFSTPGSFSTASTLNNSINSTPIPPALPFTSTALGGANAAGITVVNPYVQWTGRWLVNLEEAASTVDKETNDLFDQHPESYIRRKVDEEVDTMYQPPIRQDPPTIPQVTQEALFLSLPAFSEDRQDAPATNLRNPSPTAPHSASPTAH
jgi:hypothetical protein